MARGPARSRHRSASGEGWAASGRPLIVRRRVPGETGDAVPLGLPLPPADGKRRIGLALPASALSPAPAVARPFEAAAHAPEPWGCDRGRPDGTRPTARPRAAAPSAASSARAGYGP
ncbi:hypothetical protein ACU4GR_21470 [Methylobacterium oryzae CBMB20]